MKGTRFQLFFFVFLQTCEKENTNGLRNQKM